jgi:hypothetical protein
MGPRQDRLKATANPRLSRPTLRLAPAASIENETRMSRSSRGGGPRRRPLAPPTRGGRRGGLWHLPRAAEASGTSHASTSHATFFRAARAKSRRRLLSVLPVPTQGGNLFA